MLQLIFLSGALAYSQYYCSQYSHSVQQCQRAGCAFSGVVGAGTCHPKECSAYNTISTCQAAGCAYSGVEGIGACHDAAPSGCGMFYSRSACYSNNGCYWDGQTCSSSFGATMGSAPKSSMPGMQMPASYHCANFHTIGECHDKAKGCMWNLNKKMCDAISPHPCNLMRSKADCSKFHSYCYWGAVKNMCMGYNDHAMAQMGAQPMSMGAPTRGFSFGGSFNWLGDQIREGLATAGSGIIGAGTSIGAAGKDKADAMSAQCNIANSNLIADNQKEASCSNRPSYCEWNPTKYPQNPCQLKEECRNDPDSCDGK